ncbi:TPA: M20/M25/M40 family metallo-hydrolase [Candidatus Bathyarchaeota archaeon]|nr:M20/M25/M40 family metallo-hydrolase [Candidatus Bathyarchaeota archaeon]
MSQSRAFKWIDEHRAESIEYLQELVRRYPEGEEPLQTHLAEHFRELGCDVHVEKLLPTDVQLNKEFAVKETIDMVPRTHIIGRLRGSGGGRSLMLITHPDGDPIKTDGWAKPPHTGLVEGGRMYGWGVADDLAGIAMMVEATRAVSASGAKLRGDVYLMSACAKRNAWGIAALLRAGYRTDAGIYVHPGESELGMKEIKSMTSGLLKLRITVTGRRPSKTEFVQTTFNHLGVNPIEKAAAIIAALNRLNEERNRRVYYKALVDAVGRSTNLLVPYIQSGSASNLTDVPPSCVIGASITFPPNEDIDAVMAEVEAYLGKLYDSDEHLRTNRPALEWIQGTQGVEMAEDLPVVQVTKKAIEAVTGEEPFSNPLYSKSDLRTPVLIAGIPNVALGPLAGDLATTGGVDEWVDVDDYVRSIKVLAKIIIDWCG